MVAVEIVKDAGFEALEAETADDALLVLETRSDVRIIFTDVDLPGSMDGLALAAAARARWEAIGTAVTSGNRSSVAGQTARAQRLYCKALQIRPSGGDVSPLIGLSSAGVLWPWSLTHRRSD